MDERPASHLAQALLALALGVTIGGCGGGHGGGEDGAGGDPGGDASGPDTGFVPAARLPGPCTSSFAAADGTVTPGYIHRAYDADKRLIVERTTAVAELLGTTSWDHRFTYGSHGRVVHESFTTSLADLPNYEWQYVYDAGGRVIAQTGYEGGWTRASCTIEYFGQAPDGGHKGLKSARICAYEIDHYDKDRRFTYTSKGKHYVTWEYGKGQQVEQWSEQGASSYDKVITRFYDERGRLERVETDWSLRGYSEHTVRYTYDAAGNLVQTATDGDGDGTSESFVRREWDAHGNELKTEFDDDGDGKVDRSWLHDYSCWGK